MNLSLEGQTSVETECEQGDQREALGPPPQERTGAPEAPPVGST